MKQKSKLIQLLKNYRLELTMSRIPEENKRRVHEQSKTTQIHNQIHQEKHITRKKENKNYQNKDQLRKGEK